MPAAAGPDLATIARMRVARPGSRADSGAQGNVAAAHRARACRGDTATPGGSMSAPREQLLDLADCLGGIQILRTRFGAVHDRVAAVQPERILQRIESLAGRFVAAVDDPAVGGEQRGGPEKAIAVPPVARAG